MARQVELEDGPAIDNAAVQEKLAEFYVRSQGLKFTKFRGMTALSRGQTPGPESSIIKVVAANKLQDILSYGLDMIGMAGPTMGDTMPVAGIFEEALLYSPALRLAGGTDEIMKNIIAERVLGLPQDPRADKGMPFRDIPTGARKMTTHKLHSFFWPESIAVLGASPDLHRIRGRLLHQLRENGFPGRILPINPSYQEIDGLPCYPVHRRGWRPRRSGAGRDPGRRRRRRGRGMRPSRGEKRPDHQLGFRRGRRRRRRHAGRASSPSRNAPASAPAARTARATTTRSAASPPPSARRSKPRKTTAVRCVSESAIGVIAQSGGIGFALFNRGKAAGLGFSYVISTGNEADLTMADFLDYMVEDAHTDAVMLFCEAVRNGPGFVAALEKARRLGKPVIAIKVGRSDAGTRATASHTASLSGSHTAYHAVFERYGVIEAEDADEAVAIAGARADLPAAERPPRRHHHRVRRRRRLDGGHAVGARPDRAATLSAADAGWLAPADAVLWRLRQSGRCHRARVQHRSGDDDGHGTSRRTRTRSTCWCWSRSLASETRVSLDAARIRAVAAKCGKPMTVWTYTLPSEFGRNAAAGCGLFVHSDLRNCRRRDGQAGGLRRVAGGGPLPEPFAPVSGRLVSGPAADGAGISGEAGAGRLAAATRARRLSPPPRTPRTQPNAWAFRWC